MTPIILCTTDFSETAASTFEAALILADRLRAKIVFLHVEHVPAVEIQASGGMLEQVMQHRRKVALEGLQAMRMKTAEYAFRHNTEIETDHILTTGMVVEEIIHAAHSIKANLVLIGSPLRHHSAGLFSGSVSSTLIRKLTCPLMVVPEKRAFFEEGEILWSTGWDKGDDLVLAQVITLATQLGKKVHILHVVENQHENTIKAIENHISEAYSDRLKSEQIVLFVKENVDVKVAILNHLERYSPSLLVVGHHKSMFEFFQAQIASAMAESSQIPVLIYQS